MFYEDNYNSIPDNQSPNRQYSDFEASLLFCNQCRQAMPVRKKILLYLPDGTMYQYVCARCGSSLGTKTDKGGMTL